MSLSVWRKAVCVAALAATAQADFSYEETTRISGGSMTRMMRMIPGGGKALQPTKNQVFLKGNRMAQLGPERGSIIDLDAETMTEINYEKKTVAVITFAEYRAAMQAMAARMSAAKKDAGTQQAQMSMRASVKDLGQDKVINGMNTHGYLLSLAMDVKTEAQPGPAATLTNIDNEMWTVAKVAGYDEVQQFYMRMGQKMGFSPGLAASMMAQMQGSEEALKKMAEEMSKLKGTPVYTVMRMKGMGGMGAMFGGGGGARGGGQAQEEESATPGRIGAAAIGGMLGGFGRRKREEKEAAPAPASGRPTTAAGDDVLMEVISESAGFSSAPVDAAKLQPPAGFKEVEHEMKKLAKQK